MFIIGSPDAVRGFALVGVRGEMVTNREELDRAIDEALADESIDILLLTEDVAGFDRERVDNLITRSTMPLIVEIPGPEGPDPDRPPLSDIIRRTIGVRI